jgi:phosphoribosyl 1,2-cyclic phosphodiesterase
VNIHEIDNTDFSIDDFALRSEYICHPGPTVGYRCQLDKNVVSYLPDHEPSLGSSDFPNSSEWCSGYNIAREADLLLHDSQYTPHEYKRRIGWGHCSIEDAIDFAILAEAKKLVIFHHDPGNTDRQLEKMFSQYTRNKNPDLEVLMGQETDVFYLDS